ncbi:PorV/PorQ family protein [Candidatus Chrysopegis kryptomonas]|uniref:PorV/PorQ family protein n=1 Tax=Candidatus Chryseopegocella kryptomonas TaxID=1633643 RepID=A0A0P1MY23_9BACT|nr:PorV/PorQ family protein [Candidatus Chrysopegis kryptomonas]CUT01058.1 hypothetical protein JGI23_00975 [Candidatus Chrysopegis kryptomonas]
MLRVITILLLLVNLLYAGGKTGFGFLNIGVDARVIALGDAGVALQNGVQSIYYNPSAISSLTKPEIVFTYKNWLVDGKIIHSSFGIPWKFINIGFSLTSFTISNIEIRNRPGKPEGTFAFRNFAFAFTISPSVKSPLKFGLTTKYIFEKIFIDEVWNLAFDLGLAYKIEHSKIEINTGASIKNLGRGKTFRQSKTYLPTTGALGAAISYAPFNSSEIKLLLCTEFRHRFVENLNSSGFGLGVDLGMFSIYSGYEFGGQFKSVGFGFGINLNRFSLNYAFSPLELDLPNSHTFTIEFKL